MDPAQTRRVYADLGTSYIPRILSLVDKNPLSPTYGCFDKSYWHYKTIDFPSGMYQECVLPLTLVYKYEIPGAQRYHGNKRIKDIVEAGMRFAARSSHSDGSSDDYYPFERAIGASTFSLYACAESYIELEMDDEEIVDFFIKRGSWLLKRQETGRLTNHQALCAISLYDVYLTTGDERYLEGAQRRVDIALEWQDDEGWFQEYEGADPGYQTFTIHYLGKYYKKSGQNKFECKLTEPLRKAIEFARYFIHPDGSYGGEYGSRNTYNFYPCGFELLSELNPVGTWINDLWASGALRGKRAYVEDERIFFHAAGNFLEAYVNFSQRDNPPSHNPPTEQSEPFVKYFPNAKMYVRNDDAGYTVISLAKGGVMKHFAGEEHICSDTGLTGELEDGRVVVSHQMGAGNIVVSDDKVEVSGRFGYASYNFASPLKLIIFRLAMLTVGRFFPNLIRRLLQSILITGKKKAPISFKRAFDFTEGIRIIDEIKYLDFTGGVQLKSLYSGVDQTSIYVVMSNQFQESQLTGWLDLSEYLPKLNAQGEVKIVRVLGK